MRLSTDCRVWLRGGHQGKAALSGPSRQAWTVGLLVLNVLPPLPNGDPPPPAPRGRNRVRVDQPWVPRAPIGHAREALYQCVTDSRGGSRSLAGRTAGPTPNWELKMRGLPTVLYNVCSFPSDRLTCGTCSQGLRVEGTRPRGLVKRLVLLCSPCLPRGGGGNRRLPWTGGRGAQQLGAGGALASSFRSAAHPLRGCQMLILVWDWICCCLNSQRLVFKLTNKAHLECLEPAPPGPG